MLVYTLPRIAQTLQITRLKRLQDSPGSVPDAHFPQDARNIIFHRAFRDSERLADFTIIVTARYQAENFCFAPGESFRRLRARKIATNASDVVQQALSHCGVHQRTSTSKRANPARPLIQ